MQISARNTLKGRVKHIAPGAVNTEVTVELPGGGPKSFRLLPKPRPNGCISRQGWRSMLWSKPVM
jgi:hypothetical protein